MSLPGCERADPPAGSLRRALASSVLSSVLSLGPGCLPPWRFEPRPAPAAVLAVGEPTPSLAYGAAWVPG